MDKDERRDAPLMSLCGLNFQPSVLHYLWAGLGSGSAPRCPSLISFFFFIGFFFRLIRVVFSLSVSLQSLFTFSPPLRCRFLSLCSHTLGLLSYRSVPTADLSRSLHCLAPPRSRVISDILSTRSDLRLIVLHKFRRTWSRASSLCSDLTPHTTMFNL